MLFRTPRILTIVGMLAAAGYADTAFGQFWCCPPCCCPPPVCVQPAFKTVAMTEIREVRQVVQKPVVETKYVEQPVTEYKQVVEQKTAEIPTVSYQNVTEMHTVQRDCGRWVTQMHCRPKMSPCQYDGRPDLFGFLNRTQYSVRMAFTPDYYAERMYVPNVVAQQIPVTRQVAVRGTQTINYNVARMVPVQSTRRVAINTVRMVSEEVVTQRPVTVMKVVPFGSTLAFGTPANGLGAGTSTAARPSPGNTAANATLADTSDSDAPATSIQPKRSAQKPATSERTARREPEAQAERPAPFEHDEEPSLQQKKKRDGSTLHLPAAAEDEWQFVDASEVIRPAGKWVARKKGPTGPTLPEITIASND